MVRCFVVLGEWVGVGTFVPVLLITGPIVECI
jgi:hypothetical protein